MDLRTIGRIKNIFGNATLADINERLHERQRPKTIEDRQYQAMSEFRNKVTEQLYDLEMMSEPYNTTLYRTGDMLGARVIDTATNRSVEIEVRPDGADSNKFKVSAIAYKDANMKTFSNRLDEWANTLTVGKVTNADYQVALILTWLEPLMGQVKVTGKGEWIPPSQGDI